MVVSLGVGPLKPRKRSSTMTAPMLLARIGLRPMAVGTRDRREASILIGVIVLVTTLNPTIQRGIFEILAIREECQLSEGWPVYMKS